MKKLSLILLSFLLIIQNSIAKEKIKIESKSITFAAIGDIVMHIPVKVCAKSRNKIVNGKSVNNRGFDYLFEPSAYIFKKHDAVIANMEFPIVKPYRSRAYNFNCEPEIIPAMRKAGINIVTFANNHSYDKGPRGVIKTLKTLEKYKMKFIGAGINEEQARKGLIINKNGLKIGLIAYTNIFNINRNRRNPGRPRVNDLRKKYLVLQDIKRMKAKVDFLILNVHWGIEYKIRPRRYEINFAKTYLDAGVDLIIGHHPHVLQSIERYKAQDGRSCLIVYSLGNYISNQAYYYNVYKPVRKGRERDSIILSLKITKKQKPGLITGKKRYATFLEKAVVIPVWTVNERNYRTSITPINIRTFPIHDLLKIINSRLQKNPYNKKYLLRKKRMLKLRLKEIKRVLFRKGIPDKVEFYSRGEQT